MNEYKIEVANEAESKEVQELFFELGYVWRSSGKSLEHTNEIYLFITSGALTYEGRHRKEFFNASPHQQITLPELRILAMLKRNDVSDATHVDEDGDKWFMSGGDCYILDSYDGWVKKNKTTAQAYNPQPITLKNEITPTEALERFRGGLLVDAKYSEAWKLIDIRCSIDTLLKATALRVPAPNSITLNGTEYTEDEALKLIWNHFND